MNVSISSVKEHSARTDARPPLGGTVLPVELRVLSTPLGVVTARRVADLTGAPVQAIFYQPPGE